MPETVFESKFVTAVEEIDFPSERWRYLLSANDVYNNGVAEKVQGCGFTARQVQAYVNLINSQTTEFLISTYLCGGVNAKVACSALQIRTSKDDKDKLIRLLDSPIAAERELAVRAFTYRLGESFESEIVPKLYELSKIEKEPAVLESLCYAMYHLGAQESVSHLKHLVSHSDPAVRFALAACFFGTDDQDGVNCLMALSRDEDPEVRNWAVTGLGSALDDLEDLLPLKNIFVDRLADTERFTRLEAISALSKFKDKDERALSVLIAELNTDPVPLIAVESAISFASPELRSHLVKLLDRTEDDPIIPVIKAALEVCQ